MNYKEWERFYRYIIDDFGFSEEMDIESARILNEILKNKKINDTFGRLKRLIYGKKIVIFGAGPSLEKSIEKYRSIIERTTKISADGATTALLRKGITPDVVVTDLDGKIEDLILANKRGSIVVLHAHGDNVDALKRFGSIFKDVIGTTQTNPARFDRLFNFGGFTDGDRAVFLAEELGARDIYLIGFDFDGEIGKYSFATDEKTKRKKLEWCKLLLREAKNITFLK